MAKTTFKTSASITPKSSSLAKVALIFKYTHASASSLLTAFDDAKAKRGNVRGVLSDQEQDILRAALIMCCSGVDAAIKQAIRDCISLLVECDSTVKEGFEKFIQKRIGGEGDILELSAGSKFLALILADKTPRERLIEEYIKDLTGDSLQSAEEMLHTAAALGIDQKSLSFDIKKLKEIFKIRNMIIHELDIDLNAPGRKRRVRSQTDLIDNADHILASTRILIEQLDKKLTS